MDSALGRVSAEEVDSPSDVPEFASSMMDGYAVRSSELRSASSSNPVSFKVKGSLSPASTRPSSRLTGRCAYYVATGAPVPSGADAVVKVEETRIDGDNVLVSYGVPKWKNIAPKGDDIRAGTPLVRPGQIVNAADVALLVSARRNSLAVVRNPRVGVLSTGDELACLGNGDASKRVNNYANLIAAYLADAGANPVLLGVVGDDQTEIAKKVTNYLGDLDALITIGGSSVGRKDFTANALRNLSDCEELFHGIRLVPARPAGMFILHGRPIILLPGHSVAAAFAFFLLAHPVINLLTGLDYDSRKTQVQAKLTEEFANPRPLGALSLVSLRAHGGSYTASPLRWGSNLISSLRAANAFFEVPPRSRLGAGQSVTVTLLGGRELQRIGSEIGQ